MAWNDRTTEEKQKVLDILNREAQPYRDGLERATRDRDDAPDDAGKSSHEQAIATYQAELGPIEDAIVELTAGAGGA